MAPTAVSLALPAVADAGTAHTLRAALPDGAETTVHVARHDTALVRARVVVLPRPESLISWCGRTGTAEAVVGGFFVRPSATPLGEVRTGGIERRHVPFDPPWGARRACVHVEAERVAIARRDELARTPRGDLLQAGPLLVRDGGSQIAPGVDAEGFSAGRRQFDSDITVGRYPRAALGVAGSTVWAVACDGRAEHDAGLTMGELAAVMVLLGARTAVNLDGGGSTSLVSAGRMVNRAREQHGIDLPYGRAIVTALAFLPRARVSWRR